jgi:hypothetical protein
VSSAATHTANDVSSEVTLLRAVVFAVTDATTILADLVFVVTKRTIERRQLAKLVALVVILALRCRSSLKQHGDQRQNAYPNTLDIEIVTYSLDNSVNQPDTGNDFFIRVGQDKAMQVLFSILSELIWTGLALFNASLSADTDFCATLFLHLLQAVSTGTHEQPKEVDLWELLDWNIYLFGWTLGTLLLMVFDRGTEIRIILHCAINKANAFIL